MRRVVVGVGIVAAVLVAEVAVFGLVANWIGIVWTLLLVISTTPVGAWLARREGMRGWRRMRAAVDAGRPAGRAATEGVLGLFSALLLVVPGLVTDLVGLVLMVPPVRAFAATGVRGFAERRMSPLVVGDLFGPRRVRTSRGFGRGSGVGPAGGPEPTATGGADAAASAAPGRGSVGFGASARGPGAEAPFSPVIEGEIVDRFG